MEISIAQALSVILGWRGSLGICLEPEEAYV